MLEKIARICWNDCGWIMPSGQPGKSKNSNEWKLGFGYEEWLLDFTKLIDGYHYGFLGGVYKYPGKYDGQVFDVSLYTINGVSRDKFWVGEIKNVEIVSQISSEQIYRVYETNGWIAEMAKQIKNASDKYNSIHDVKFSQKELFNVRFKKENADIFPNPISIGNDPAIRSYYYTLLNKFREPVSVKRVKE